MSRVANIPILIPNNVEVSLNNKEVTIKGSKGELKQCIHDGLDLGIDAKEIRVKVIDQTKQARVLAGTTRSIVNNMVVGVSTGYEKRLTLIGVGYRAQVKGKVLNMALGFSHPIEYKIPDGIEIETPSQTDVVVKGIDKQLVGQVAANIRSYRPPEPYKGKGVRYNDEHVVRKEAKKK